MRYLTLVLAGSLLLSTELLVAQSNLPLPERAVRRDIPITNSIRRALELGTRDSTGRPGKNYWNIRTDYAIDAVLDVNTSRLTGKATITLHNNSNDALTNIALKLNMNHFIESNPRAAPWVLAESTDGMVITRLTVNGAVANTSPTPAQMREAQQGAASVPLLTNGNSTRANIVLPTPIAARSKATLEIEWNHKIPGGPGSGHRMTQRWADSLYQPTQWFPRVAMYDDLAGWDPEFYLGPSEFYNPFGSYDVKIDVPAGWIVSGTGVLQNPEQVLTAEARSRLQKVTSSTGVTTIVGPDEIGPGKATATGNANGRLVWHFRADTVNDFAWATARKFVWTATSANIPEKGPVPIHMLYLPGRANLFARAPDIMRHALEFYSKLWFPYEFPQMTMQDGPSAGMEYPMVVNSNAGAADHEAGHMWWPMVVGTNETQRAWMDEGLNQYMNLLSAADAAGRPVVLDGLGQSYGLRSGDDLEPPMMWNTNYDGPASYSYTTYRKAPLMLSSLGGVVGDSAVQRGIREWGRAWKYKHPSPWDFMFFMNNTLKQDLGWFWYYWLFTTESVDGRIDRVTPRADGATVIVKQDGQMPSPVILEVKFAASGPPIRRMANMVMTDSVTAIVTWPVDVWFSGSRTFTADLATGRAIERVTLDPHKRFPDRKPDDNVWSAPGR